jgi:hypothetical protein
MAKKSIVQAVESASPKVELPRSQQVIHLQTNFQITIGKPNKEGTKTEPLQITGQIPEFSKEAWAKAFEDAQVEFLKATKQ